jgi:hypothetical protein
MGGVGRKWDRWVSRVWNERVGRVWNRRGRQGVGWPAGSSKTPPVRRQGLAGVAPAAPTARVLYCLTPARARDRAPQVTTAGGVSN